MKRFYTLIVLLGLTLGVLTGCNQAGTDNTGSTNAAPSATSGTNGASSATTTNAPAK